MPKKQQQNDMEFAKGVSVKVQETKFGDIIKLGVNVEQFLENEPNEAGFINIEIKLFTMIIFFNYPQKAL